MNFLDDAKTDLAEIASRIAIDSGSDEFARRYVERIISRCERLARFPGELGRARPELLVGLRSLPFGRYLIFFRYVEDRLDIVNVLHGARDLDAFFKDPIE